MKQLKKVLAIVLSIVITLTAAPLNGLVGMKMPDGSGFKKIVECVTATFDSFSTKVQAAEIYSGTCGANGDNLTWTLNTETGVLNITGEGAMTDWTSSSNAPWHSYCDSIKTVNIGNGVTTIGESAFGYCESITSVTVPDSVRIIGESAFSGCSSICDVIYNGTYEQWDEIYVGSYNSYLLCALVFGKDTDRPYYCFGIFGQQLEWILYADGELVITGIGEMTLSSNQYSHIPWFGYGSKIKSVTIGNGITNICENAFYSCENLISITIPDSVTSIGISAFKHCDSLTNITIPDSVTSIGREAFYYSDLTSITIGKNVTSIGANAFYGTAYHFDTNNWLYQSALYIGDYLLEVREDRSGSFSIKDGTVVIADSALSNCAKLTSVTIPDSVISIGTKAFYNCTNLTNIVIGNSVTRICESAFDNTGYFNDTENWVDGVLYIGKYLIDVNSDISSSYSIKDGTLVIADYAFNNCTNLKSITIPDSVTRIGVSAFGYCPDLQDTYYTGDIAGWLSISFITGTSNPMYSAEKLYIGDELVYDIVIPDSVSSIGSFAFYDCESLTTITIPDSVTSIGSYACYDCESLTIITIPDSIKHIGKYAFGNCYYIENVIYNGTSEQWKNITIDYGNSSLLSALLFGQDTDRPYYAPGRYGENLEWIFYVDGELVISGVGAMTECQDSFDIPWTVHNNEIKSVTIGNGVTTICEYAFDYSENIATVTIPKTLTKIGDFAFHGCYSIADVYYSSTHSDWRKILIGDFNDAIDSATIHYTVPELEPMIVTGECGDSLNWSFDTASGSLRIMGTGPMWNWSESFCAPWDKYCSYITSVIIDNSVTSIGDYAFAYCDVITNIAISEGIITIGRCAFYDCDSLISLTNSDTVTTIGEGAFYSCDSLTSLTLGNSLTTIGNYAFFLCIGLTNIIIPDSVTTIGEGAFYVCEGLTSLTLGSSIITIGNYAFSRCTGLTNISIPDSVTTIGEAAFLECIYLTSVSIGHGVETIGGGAFYYCNSLTVVFYGSNEEDWADVSIAEGNDPLTSATFYYAVGFGGCGNNVTWSLYDNGLLRIKGTGEMFNYSLSLKAPWYEYCSIIKKVEIDDGITTIGDGAFIGLYELESFIVPDNITSIGAWAFCDCNSLAEITIPDSVSFIGDGAFDGCDNLTDIYYRSTESDWDKITIGFANEPLTSALIHFDYIPPLYFGACGNNLRWGLYADGLLKISGSGEMSEGTYYIDDIGVYAQNWYQYRSLVKIIEIAEGITTISNYAFVFCENVTSVTIPDSVISIGQLAFAFCSDLESATIPEGVTTVEMAVFGLCSSLTSVTIPDSVTSIGDSAFSDCSSLTDVYYGSTEEDWNKISIGPDNEPLLSATVHLTEVVHTHTYEWVITEPTATQDGLKIKRCSDCGDESETSVIPATGFEEINGMVVDYASNTIYGLSPGINSLEGYTDIVADGYEWTYTPGQFGGFGTGTKAILKNGDETIAEYTLLIYGDLNGDGWYDGEDAFLTNLIVAGMFTQDNLPDYMWKAADCNHDDVIDETDVDLLMGAGVKLNDIDQNATLSELAAQSAYIEYMSIISQSAGLEVEDTAPETNETVEGTDFGIFLAQIFLFIRKIFNFVFSFVIK